MQTPGVVEMIRGKLASSLFTKEKADDAARNEETSNRKTVNINTQSHEAFHGILRDTLDIKL